MNRYKLIRKAGVIEIFDTENHDKHIMFPIIKPINRKSNEEFAEQICNSLNLVNELEKIYQKLGKTKLIENITNCNNVIDVKPENIQECS